jgi:hypothetical protein
VSRVTADECRKALHHWPRASRDFAYRLGERALETVIALSEELDRNRVSFDNLHAALDRQVDDLVRLGKLATDLEAELDRVKAASEMWRKGYKAFEANEAVLVSIIDRYRNGWKPAFPAEWPEPFDRTGPPFWCKGVDHNHEREPLTPEQAAWFETRQEGEKP